MSANINTCFDPIPQDPVAFVKVFWLSRLPLRPSQARGPFRTTIMIFEKIFMRRIALLYFCMLTSAVHAQTLEKIVEDWLNDAPNAFQNAFEAYGRTGNGYFSDIDYFNSSGWRSFGYHVGFEMKPTGTPSETYKEYETLLASWDLLTGWDVKKSPDTEIYIRYQRKIGDETQEVFLQQGYNYDASKSNLVTLTIAWSGLKGTKKQLPKKDEKPDPVTGETMSIVGRLRTPEGRAAFLQLANDSVNGFENIIVKDTLQDGVYQIVPSYLNPKSTGPFIHVEDGELIRKLVIRFVQPNGEKADYSFAEGCIALDLDSLMEANWIVDDSDAWNAVSKKDKYRKCYKRWGESGDYLVMEAPVVGHQKKRVDAVKERVLKNLGEHGYSLLDAAYFPVSELPKDLEWDLHSGNYYYAAALCSETDPEFQLILKKELSGYANSLITGSESSTETIIEGEVKKGFAEMGPDTTKSESWDPMLLELNRISGGNPDDLICLLFAYKSKDNATNDADSNYPEDYYSKQDDESFEEMEDIWLDSL